jgi:hypothetical protein
MVEKIFWNTNTSGYLKRRQMINGAILLKAQDKILKQGMLK